MLASTGFTPLLVNFESMTTKPKTGDGHEKCVGRKAEKAVHYFVHTDKATTDSSTDKVKQPQPPERFLIWGVTQPLYKLKRTFVDSF